MIEQVVEKLETKEADFPFRYPDVRNSALMSHSLQGRQRHRKDFCGFGVGVTAVERDTQLGRHLVAHALPLVLLHRRFPTVGCCRILSP